LPAPITIRAATPSDAESISSCLAQAFGAYRGAYTAAAFADTVPTAAQVLLRIQKMHVLVAIAESNVVGTVSATIHADCGHLRGMAVLPEQRSAGTAAALLTSIEDWLRSHGCGEVALDTTEPLAAAMKFYEKHGYRRSGKISDFFGMPLIEYVKRP
jgi:GNAT superfamily N-acetyltransferase